MLVIHPDECIDCGVCEPECPVDAIKADSEPGLEKWLSLNTEYAKIWPNITIKKAPPSDWKEWEGKSDKLQYFSTQTRNRGLNDSASTIPSWPCDAGLNSQHYSGVDVMMRISRTKG